MSSNLTKITDIIKDYKLHNYNKKYLFIYFDSF